MTAAAAPSVVVEIIAIAGRLEHTPRERTSAADLIFDKAAEGRRLRKLAERIEIIEPIAKRPGAAPRLARIAAKPARARSASEGQMSLAL